MGLPLTFFFTCSLKIRTGGLKLNEGPHRYRSTSVRVCFCSICGIRCLWLRRTAAELGPTHTFLPRQKWSLDGRPGLDVHDFATRRQRGASHVSERSVVQRRERTRIRFYRAPLFPPVNIFTLELVFSSLSWPRVCYSVLCVCDGRQPAADCSEITEMVKAAEGAWTSCWAQLKVMYRTRLVVTWHDRYPPKKCWIPFGMWYVWFV